MKILLALSSLFAFLVANVASVNGPPVDAEDPDLIKEEEEQSNVKATRLSSDNQAEILLPSDGSSQKVRDLHDYYYACEVIEHDTVLEYDILCKCEYYYGKKKKYYKQLEAAVIVKGHAKLDLNGHYVKCIDDTYPKEAVVLVLGQENVVKNGHVSGNGDCVSLRGGGYHSLEYLYMYGCGGSCIHVSQDTTKNKIQYNDLKYCGAYGIDMCESPDNKARYNSVYYTKLSGIEVGGAYNLVSYNNVSGTDEYGILLSGYDNRIAHNYVSYSKLNCIDVSGGYNIVGNNHISECEDSGIDVTGSYNDVRGNYIYYIGDDCIEVGEYAVSNNIWGSYIEHCGDDGIDINGAYNYIKSNDVYYAYDIGVLMDATAHDNVIHRNKAYYSGYLDLYDANYDCDGNIWTHNKGTRKQDCIE